MNILFVYENPISSFSGGVERITFLLANYLEHDFNVFFIAFKNSIDDVDYRQSFVPNLTDINSKENCLFIESFIKSNDINVVLNKSATSKKISNVLNSVDINNAALISVLHNSVLGVAKNFSILKRKSFENYNVGFLLKLFDFKLFKYLILILYKLKYSNHYKKIIINSHTVVLESNSFIKELCYISNVYNTNNIISIPNFVNTEKNGFDVKKKELLFVGRINTYQKRVDLLLDIWAIFSVLHPDWILNVVGGGDELPKIIKLSKQLDLKNIYFHGFCDASEFYDSASIICLTSCYEGFGISLVEGMSRGAIPFAFNSYASVSDIIENNVDGFLIDPFDVEEYANKLSYVASSKINLKKFSSNALLKSQTFDLLEIGPKWKSLLNTFE